MFAGFSFTFSSLKIWPRTISYFSICCNYFPFNWLALAVSHDWWSWQDTGSKFWGRNEANYQASTEGKICSSNLYLTFFKEFSRWHSMRCHYNATVWLYGTRETEILCEEIGKFLLHHFEIVGRAIKMPFSSLALPEYKCLSGRAQGIVVLIC